MQPTQVVSRRVHLSLRRWKRLVEVMGDNQETVQKLTQVEDVIFFSAPQQQDHIVRHLLCGLRQEELQTAHLMSITWASHIAASVLTGR